MSYVVLARKYRPRSFDEMVGQEHVVRALTNALQNQRLHHAYLFTGTRGIGKTTVSRILAKSLNCTGPDGTGGVTAKPCGTCGACTEIDADRYIDYIELDAASNRSIDEIRDLIERAAYKPSVGRFKVFMIDEAHQLTKDAFNALLKTLEEPPEYLKFVLATTDPEKMLPTVLSRCLQFNLRPMAPETVREHLARVLAAEHVPHDEGSLRLLARAARGSMRDGLSLTDQAIAYGAGTLEEGAVRAMLGSVDRSHAAALVEALARRDGAAVLAEVDTLRGRGLSASGTLEEMATLLQQMAIEQAVPGALDAADPDHADAVRLAPALAADETQLLYSMAIHGRDELPLMSDEYGALTMVLLRLLAFPSADAPRAPARAQPLRAAKTAALSLPLAPPRPAPVKPAPPPPAVPPPTAARASEPPPPADRALGDRWQAVVQALVDQGAVTALVRELAWQAGLAGIDTAATPPRWRLLAERESLRAPQLVDKLTAALTSELGAPLALDVQPGVPEDSPAKRDAAERARRQAQAEDTIRNDPVVQTLMSQFKTARIVPGSIKPV
jgi:DNA polymerase III subunit gamma/tau